ncbi:Protein of unknown function (DUF1189) [Parelusimicrobium proximum]
MFIVDFFKSFYDFRNYRTTFKRSGWSTFALYLLTVICYAAISYFIFVGIAGKIIPYAAKNLPAVEMTSGKLKVNNGRPYTIVVPLKMSLIDKDGNLKKSTAEMTALKDYALVEYDPSLTFPPSYNEFVNSGTVAFFTDTHVYAMGSYGQVEARDYKSLGTQNQRSSSSASSNSKDFKFAQGEAMKYVPTGMMYLKIGTAVILGLMTPFSVIFNVIFTFIIGLIVNAFMKRNVTAGNIFKLAFYIQVPLLLVPVIKYLTDFSNLAGYGAFFLISIFFYNRILAAIAKKDTESVA